MENASKDAVPATSAAALVRTTVCADTPPPLSPDLTAGPGPGKYRAERLNHPVARYVFCYG